jgi:hypothetical protein
MLRKNILYDWEHNLRCIFFYCIVLILKVGGNGVEMEGLGTSVVRDFSVTCRTGFWHRQHGNEGERALDIPANVCA